MEKEDLLENLNYTKNVLKESDKLREEWSNIIYRKPQIISFKWYIIIIIFATSIGKSYPLTSLFCLLSPILVYRYNKKLISQNKSFILSQKSEMHEPFEQNIKALEKSVIPAKYMNLRYLNKIESYLVNQRADTLKECLNLLEDDIKHNQQIENLQVIQDQNEAMLLQRTPLQSNKETKFSWA